MTPTLTPADRPTADELEALTDKPHQGWNANLYYDDGATRFWVNRTTRDDGEPFDRTVDVEALIDGRWESAARYDGDCPEREEL